VSRFSRRKKPIDHYVAAIHASTLEPNDRLVLRALSDYMGFDDLDSARPGVPSLARYTGLSQRTVQRCLGRLVQLGALKIVRKGGTTTQGQKRATVYRGVLPTGDTWTPVDSFAPVTCETGPVTPTTRTGDTEDKNRCHGDALSVLKERTSGSDVENDDSVVFASTDGSGSDDSSPSLLRAGADRREEDERQRRRTR
jgi:hypothetical protein